MSLIVADKRWLGQLALAAAVGVFYYFLMGALWAFIPFFNPITNTLFQCCTSEPWFTPVIQVHDLILNVLLSVPLALFLHNLNAGRIWWLVLTALLAALVFWNYHLIYPNIASDLITRFLPGLVRENLALPVAAILVLLIRRDKKNQAQRQQ